MSPMPPCAVAGGLSGLQVAALIFVAVAALVLVYLVGRDDGREEARAELFKNARENGVDPRWLQPVIQVERDPGE